LPEKRQALLTRNWPELSCQMSGICDHRHKYQFLCVMLFFFHKFECRNSFAPIALLPKSQVAFAVNS